MNIKRYLSIYGVLIKLSLSQQMQYRSHFLLDALTTMLWASMRVLFYWVTFEHITTVGDWDKASAMTLAGVYLVIQALYKLFFEKNFFHFSLKVYRGELDQILLKPVSAQFVLSFKEFRVSALIRLAAAIALLALALMSADKQLTVFSFVLFIWAIVIAMIVIFALSYITLCTIFWLGNVDNIYHFFGSIVSDAFVPFDIFPKVITGFVSFVIPLIFIATVPAKIFFGISPLWLGYGTCICLFFLYLSRKYWHKALKNYTSVSN